MADQQTTQTRVEFVLAPTMTAPDSDGDSFEAGSARLIVRNTSGALATVTVVTGGLVQGLDIEDLAVPVAAGATALIGPFPKTVFAQPDGVDVGRVLATYSVPASFVRAVIAP